MASSNQYSRGLKFFLASLVLLVLFAVTVESRGVSFTAPLLPENAGKVTSNNRNLVGQALGYVSLRGKNAFGLSILAVSNIDPKKVSRVSVFYTSNKKKVIANLTLDGGFYTYDQRIDYSTGAAIHEEKISVGFWSNSSKTEKLVIAGPLANNRATFLAYLQASEVDTAPSGTSKNDAFASIHLTTSDSVDYRLTATVNHDLDQSVTEISIHGPAPSGQTNDAWSLILTKKDQAGRVQNALVNSTVFYWMSNHLTYIVIKTSKNPNGALRGQVIPQTTPRARIPTFPNGFTQNTQGTDVTFLPDGSTVIGNLTLALLSGGARPSNASIGTVDDRVAYFFFNNQSAFNYNFRFPLPVTIANRFNTRGAYVVVSAAAEAVDTNKWTVGVYNLAEGGVPTGSVLPIEGLGNKTFSNAAADLGPSVFSDYLGPGGVFVNVAATGVSTPLYVDRFYIIYYVASAFSNNIIKDIFFRGSDVEDTASRRR
eukprot:TRINITY_DN6337_c0_g1_i1.p1 TRINITY_DN6337_c0_g1~~TRINITY_DN6337_c0_g1_i1.p1  ORF type:complete len:483 (-),score=96.43 TRINITY_DN6337_c0_g1_i1:78-1526(-)